MPGTYAPGHFGLLNKSRLSKIEQVKAASAANEGAYFSYVTEICKCSQRRKQNCYAILRLRDFFGCLYARDVCTRAFWLLNKSRLSKIEQVKAASAANEGAYISYVTEICKCSQRRKQNCYAILRLRDFFGCLYARDVCTRVFLVVKQKQAVENITTRFINCTLVGNL